MKIFGIYLAPLMAGVHAAEVKEALHTPLATVEAPILLPQNNYEGWVNPEDLAPMPQCIAQQDQSAWLSAMTKCTSKRCTSHFGLICTHHQFLTELACLGVSFSSDVMGKYLPYCARSILAKAQLYQWAHEITGRTWLVDVGDAIELQSLSPASLSEGYAAVDIISHAPKCLTNSFSALTMESFHHAMASCGFTSTAQHTGNVARPWEYNEPRQSMIALDFETAGYDLLHQRIEHGDYFDKDCFCRTFTVDYQKELCSKQGKLELTKERLWINATCGPRFLPHDWTKSLKSTRFAYIPIDNWHWPKCVADVPRQVIELTDQCATDACDIDSDGYCNVKRAVSRTCFCRSVNYNSCGGLCQVFDARIDYIKWLHGLCGNVKDWHGLPSNWQQLAAPTPGDMIPWQWTLKPSADSNSNSTTNITRPGYPRTMTESCPSNQDILESFALVNIVTFLAAAFLLTKRMRIRQTICEEAHHPWDWLFKGALIASLQLLANGINALIVQYTLGYEHVPGIKLMLLWCSMPRLAWGIILLIILVQSPEELKLSMAGSVLCAETILHCLSFYYMVMTVNYGREHSFYFGALDGVDRARPAKAMYIGALAWLMLFILALVQVIRTRRNMNRSTESGGSSYSSRPRWTVEELMIAVWNRHCTKPEEEGMAQPSKGKSTGGSENTPLTRNEGEHPAYGTFSDTSQQQHWVPPNAFMKVCMVTAVGMLFLLSIAQWLFWSGFVGLSAEEFCPPKLGVLTAVWIMFALAGAVVTFV